MIQHALSILQKELNNFLDGLGGPDIGDAVVLTNIALANGGEGDDAQAAKGLVMTLVNIREEKTLKNAPFSRRISDEQVVYFNAPVFLNLYVLISACHTNYQTALAHLSRVIRFFQSKNVFTPENSVAVPIVNPFDRMESFKMILELHSSSLEEQNQLWGMLGSKQYPSVMYMVRLLELKLTADTVADTVREVELGAERID